MGVSDSRVQWTSFFFVRRQSVHSSLEAQRGQARRPLG